MWSVKPSGGHILTVCHSPRRLRTFVNSSLLPEERTPAVCPFGAFGDFVVIKIKKNASGETKLKVRCSKVRRSFIYSHVVPVHLGR